MRPEEVPNRRGFGLADAIDRSQEHSGTYTGKALNFINSQSHLKGHDRIIVITDEQSHDPVPNPTVKKAYFINVASNKNGVGYGPWLHIDGWSENIVRYIQAMEG